MVGRPAHLEARKKVGFGLVSFQQWESHPETNLAGRGSLGDRRQHALRRMPSRNTPLQ